MSGKAGALLLPSSLRTERASFQALGSSNITLSGSVLYDGSIDVARPGFLPHLFHPYILG
nr:hypothetical protein [Stanieria cyanosphaera]